MTDLVRRLHVAAATAIVAVASAALAQPLAYVAPPDALLAFEVQRAGDLGKGLRDDLAALDWDGARDTLQRLGALTGDDFAELLDLQLFDLLEDAGSLGSLRSELRESCPDFPLDEEPISFFAEGLATLAMGPGTPFPVLTLIARVTSEGEPALARMQEALVGCFGSERLTQDGTTIHVLGQGSDLPVAIASSGDLFVAATTPDAVRGVLRRARGSEEPRLADRPLWQAAERFEGRGLGIAVDLAAVADLAEGFLGLGPFGDPVETYAGRRLLAAARTLGGLAVRVGASDEGVLLESVMAVDPAGGDPALAELLLCDACAATRPFLAPAASNGVASSRLPVRELFAYVEDWLDGLATATGEELDLRTLAREELGLDVDAAVLDWIGSHMHVVSLEPFRPTLRQLVYSRPVAIFVPVSSPEAAAQGLDLLGEALAPVLSAVLGSTDPLLGRGPSPFGYGSGGPMKGPDMVATRPQTYDGITYDRIQIGPVTDVAVALIGSHLVVASPSRAMHSVIDTFRGEAAPLDDDAFRRARAAAPAGAFAVSYMDVGASLAGVAELGRLLAQPVAAALSAAVSEAAQEPTSRGSSHPASVRHVAYRELPVERVGHLGAESTNAAGDNVSRYRLTGVPAGTRIRVAAASNAFDAYLYLLDADGTILDSNDDAGFGTDSALTFVADGRDLLIDVSSFGGQSSGPYALTMTETDLGDLPRIDVAGVTPQRLRPGDGAVEGMLRPGDVLPDGALGAYYAVDGLVRGQRVEVALTSDAFDTYLRIVDPASGAVLAENDDQPDTSRSAVSFGATGDPVWIQVSSWSGASTGPFRLEATVHEPPAAASDPAPEDASTPDSAPPRGKPTAVDPPDFAALLELVEIVPNALSVVSERVGLSVGFAHVDGDVIHRKTLIEIAW